MMGLNEVYKRIFHNPDRVLAEVLSREGKILINAKDYKLQIRNIAANARVLLGEGEKTSGFVGVRISYSADFFSIVLGLLMAGYNVLFIDEKSTWKHCGETLAEAACTILVTDEKEQDEQGYHIIQVSDLKKKAEVLGSVNWAEYIAFSTSGSVGKSKVILYRTESLSKQLIYTMDFYREAKFLKELRDEKQPGGEKVISMLPMHHIFGFITPLILLGNDFKILFPANLAVSTIIKTFAAEQVWGCLGVPMFWEVVKNIVQSRAGGFNRVHIDAVFGSQFKYALSGGTSMDRGLREAYVQAGICMTAGFGMTEIGCATMLIPAETDLYSEGDLYDWYDVKLKHEELWIRSEVMFDGYMQAGKFVDRERDDEGFFPTGDIFKMEGKRIYFVGRKKNIIVNAAGENIYMEELEKKFTGLKSHQLYYGIVPLENEPCLLVKVNDFSVVDEVRESLAAEVAGLCIYERPVKVIFTKQDLPMTAKGELRRYAVSKEILNHSENIEIIYKKVL